VGQLKIYPYGTCTVNPKNQSAICKFHLGCISHSSYSAFKVQVSLSIAYEALPIGDTIVTRDQLKEFHETF